VWSQDLLDDGDDLSVPAPGPSGLAQAVRHAATWGELHTTVVTRVNDPAALTLDDVGALIGRAALLATAGGPEEPSREQRLQCRTVVGVASLAALTVTAADEFEGGGALGTTQVAGLLSGLGVLASRRLLERTAMPREVSRLVDMLTRRARKLCTAGELGPNQLAGVMRAAALLAAPGVVDGTWLREAETQLIGSSTMAAAAANDGRAAATTGSGGNGRSAALVAAAGENMARLAHDSLAALMTATASARSTRARRWRPSTLWLRAFSEHACSAERIAELDGHQLAAVVYGLADMGWPTSSAPYVPTSDEMVWLTQQGNDRFWPGGDGPMLPDSAPLPPSLPRTWLQEVRAREAHLVRNTVTQLTAASPPSLTTQWDTTSSASSSGRSHADSLMDPEIDHACIQPSDLALLLVAYTRLGVHGFYPGRPPGLAPLPLESMFNGAGASAAAAAAVGQPVGDALDEAEDDDLSQ